MSNSAEDELVKFTVVMTSDAAMKEVSLATSSTKLSELKHILSNDEYFGSKAPVRRQRIFHLGRELKSGGRSLYNLGLGKFNNRILHLYIRPSCDDGKDGSGRENKDDNAQEDDSAAARARKRRRTALSSTPQHCHPQRYTSNVAEMGSINEDRTEIADDSGPSARRPVASTNNHSAVNNLAIDLVDSSDDDEVEIIEVL